MARVTNRRSRGVYMNLVAEVPLRPIRTRREYATAAAMVDRLALLDGAIDVDQADYLETLEMLITAYDDRRSGWASDAPLPGATPLARLQYLMGQTAMTASKLGDLLGSRPAASMVLKGTRELSKAHIRVLAARFRVDAGYFL